jgi:predicted DNA-binding ribbon-helix-helix protein
MSYNQIKYGRMTMQKVVSIRMEESLHHDLKCIAAMEGKTIAKVIEELAAERMDKLTRIARIVPVVAKGKEKRGEKE